MEEIYANVDSKASQNQRGLSGSERRFQRIAVCLGLLSVFLLTGLISLGVHLKTCPAGWHMFCCSCYLLSDESGTWDKGREDCKNRGADLVVIDRHKEEMFLSKFTKKSAWIGLSDREKEGTWKWIDETPLNLTYWRTLQPDNGGGDPKWGEEDCAEITGNAGWNDLSCKASLQWVCEKKIA